MAAEVNPYEGYFYAIMARFDQFRLKFKEFMNMRRLLQLTVHSARYIYATKLYLKGVPKDAIEVILGVDERTLKYYIKAMQERKKKVLFTYLEKVSALPKRKEKQGHSKP